MKKIVFRMLVVFLVISLSVMIFAACNKSDGNTSENSSNGIEANDKDADNSNNPLPSVYNALLSLYSNANICCKLASDQSFINFDTNPYDLDDFYSAERMDMIQFINQKLNLPDYVYEDMITTRAIDGKVSEEIGSLRLSWTYHPDKGLEILYRFVA